MTTVAEVMEVMQNKTLSEALLDEQKSLEMAADRQNYEALAEEVIAYARPDLTNVATAQRDDQTQKSGKRGTSMKTSEVYIDLLLAAYGFQTQTASPSLDWFSYRMVDPTLRDDDDVQAWLQQREQVAYQMFRRSNFYPIQTSVWKDGLSLGNAPVMIEENRELSGMTVKKFHPGNTYFQCDAEGNYLLMHRRFWLSAGEAWKLFAPSREFLSTDLLTCLRNGDQWRRFEFLQCYRRQDDLLLGKRPYEYRTRLWNSLYLQAQSDKHKDAGSQGILRTSGRADGPVEGSHLSRFANWRYDWDPEETYGRGPGQHGIVTIKRLHGSHGDVMTAAQRGLNSPLVADKMQKGRLDLNPGAVNWRDNPAQQIQRIYDRIDYPYGVDMLQRFSTEVQDLFHVSLLRILTQSEKPMTAREATLLYQEKASLIAPAVTSHERDFLEPSHANAWQIAAAEDPDYYKSMPDMLKRIYDQGGKGEIEVEFQGMLAQTQRAMVGLRRMEAALGGAEAVLAIEPTVRDKVNWDEVFEKQLDDSGWWQDTIRSDDEVAAIRQQRLQMHLQEVQAEIQQRLGSAAKSYAGAQRDIQEAAA